MVSWSKVSLARLFIAETRNLYDKCASRVLSQLKRNPCLVDEPSCSDDEGLVRLWAHASNSDWAGPVITEGGKLSWLAGWLACAELKGRQ